MAWTRWKNIMKAYPFEEKRLAKWSPPFIVQPKYDGIRCRAIPIAGGKFVLVSSGEEIITAVPHINEALVKLRAGVELDGELYCHGLPLEKINGICTPQRKTPHPEVLSIEYHVFDYAPMEAEDNTPMFERLHYLQHNFIESRYLKLSPYFMCDSLEQVVGKFRKLVDEGYEGIIVRNAFWPYERRRSTGVMKFKPKRSDIYEIVSFEEEHTVEGVPKGVLGTLVCASGDGSTFRVYSGLSDDDRAKWWKIRELLPGMSVKVGYQHLTATGGVPRSGVVLDIVP